MFNCGLNIHICTWIVSLTIILKCLLNYGIKICQNVAYHLTQQRPPEQDHRHASGVRLSVCDPRRKMKDGERGGKMKRYGRRC
jgi:hypothetical protein